MVKGWRNDPKWIELYERRDHERLVRQYARMTAEFESQEALRETRTLGPYHHPTKIVF